MKKELSWVTPGRLYLPYKAQGDKPYNVASGLSQVLLEANDPKFSVYGFHFTYALLDLDHPDYDGHDALDHFYQTVRFTPEIPASLVLQPIVTGGEREVNLDISTKVIEWMPDESPLMALEITPGNSFGHTCFFNGRLTTSRTYADALKMMSEIKRVVRSRAAHAQ